MLPLLRRGRAEADWLWDSAYWAGPRGAIWSPDSTQIAFSAALPFDPDGPHYMDQTEIWIFDLLSNQLKRLTYDDMHHGYLWWK